LKQIQRFSSDVLAGFSSWAQYCKAGRLDFKKSQADMYIRSSEIRPA
jgi:hypothetical protein